jgi:hypothetical protein
MNVASGNWRDAQVLELNRVCEPVKEIEPVIRSGYDHRNR